MASRVSSVCLLRRDVVYGAFALLSSGGMALAQPAILPDPRPERAPPERVNLLFCGDSLAQGMFLALNGQLRRREGLRITNGTLHATGVTRSDEHDWPSVARDLVTRHSPDLTIFWVGANDFRPLVVRETRSRHAFGTPAFADGYGRRVGEMVTSAVEAGSRVVWFGLPNVRQAQFAGAVRQLNEIQQSAALAAGAVWIPTWDATSDPLGRFKSSISLERGPRGFRAEDGVHFTEWGYRRIAALFFDEADSIFPELAPSLGRLTDA